MSNEQTPLEKLDQANDNYHETVNEILMLEGTSVDNKVEFACAVSNVFNAMEQAKILALKVSN